MACGHRWPIDTGGTGAQVGMWAQVSWAQRALSAELGVGLSAELGEALSAELGAALKA